MIRLSISLIFPQEYGIVLNLNYISKQINIMQHSNTQIFSQSAIDALFTSPYFIDKFQQLQIQTHNDRLKDVNQITSQSKENPKKRESVGGSSEKNQPVNMVQTDILINQISQLILHNFKQAVYKETNSFYQNKINLMNVMEDIQSIKQNLSKMGQATSFVTVSAKTTQESITPQVCDRKQPKQLNKGRNKGDGETSMFMCEQQESSIQLGASRKNLAQDRLNSFSFMNSFFNQNRLGAQEEEIINERINASISKIESSIDDRIAQLQKQFTRRIQQVMKTIKHLIQMINQNESQNSNKQVTKQKSVVQAPIIQNNIKKMDQNSKGIISSKSTIILPQNNKKIQKQIIKTHVRQHMKTEPIQVQIYTPAKSQKPGLTKTNEQTLLNRSSNKLASFFRMGKQPNPLK